jgi:uncharacterized protein YjdB
MLVEKLDLDVELNPTNVTMNNVIWESSDTSIASVDKFGVVTSKKSGKVKITVHTWDTARPIASKRKAIEYFKDGVKDTVTLEILAD